MVFKGVIIEESLKDKSVLKDLNIIKTKTEVVTNSHKTPWLKKWTIRTVEFDDKDEDIICEKLKKCIDDKHEWYIEIESNKWNILIFHDNIIKKRIFHPPSY